MRYNLCISNFKGINGVFSTIYNKSNYGSSSIVAS